MKKQILHIMVVVGMGLLLIPLLTAGTVNAVCTMTAEEIDAAAATCSGGDLDCFVALAKNRPDCAANIAWFYMITYAPENPEAVLNSFSSGLPSSYSDELSAAVDAAYQTNQNQQNAGALTSANEYPYGQ